MILATTGSAPIARSNAKVMATIHVGTSGWSYQDWVPGFYPAGTKAGDFLGHYAHAFDIVEVDSTYYRSPSRRMVEGWYTKTPDAFRFTVKTPGVITHEKVLLDCQRERDEFLSALEPLGDKLRCILLQFRYFNKKTFSTERVFFDRLDRFLHDLPQPQRFAVEIRNKAWLCDDFFDLLRAHSVSYALTEHVWMPPVERVLDDFDCLTGELAYLRLIGDRKGIERITTSWDETVVDRTDRLGVMVAALLCRLPQTEVVVFINNHFAGHAPATCRDFLRAMADADTDPTID